VKFYVSYCGLITATPGPGEVLDDPAASIEQHLDAVMDQLLELDLVDADISARLELGEVEITILVEAPSPEDAAKLGLSDIRTAVHAAGGSTPNWPQGDERFAVARESSSQRPAELIEA
jgi:hypothetical protein